MLALVCRHTIEGYPLPPYVAFSRTFIAVIANLSSIELSCLGTGHSRVVLMVVVGDKEHLLCCLEFLQYAWSGTEKDRK